ncbi:MAG: ROK family protein, partial [Lentisphaeria bacterium]|nr:ROK family protein [Lentisphaeria bacterium]
MAEHSEYLLGFDVGGTKCAAVLGRREGERLVIVDKRVFATAEQPEPDRCIGRYVEAMRGLLAAYGVKTYSGVGISCGGPLDAQRGIVLSPPNLPGWDEVHVTERLSREFDCPARLCNDADACAVAEWRFGAGRGCRNL